MEWKPTRYPGLLVNGEGQVRNASGRILKGCPGKYGHLRTSILVDGKRVNVSFHVLICEAFHGPKPHPSLHAAHLNGDAGDNHPDNLRWSTPKENALDKKAHGREARNNVKLTEKEVREIREKYDAGGISQRALAAEYGIAKATVAQIVNRVTWKEQDY